MFPVKNIHLHTHLLCSNLQILSIVHAVVTYLCHSFYARLDWSSAVMEGIGPLQNQLAFPAVLLMTVHCDSVAEESTAHGGVSSIVNKRKLSVFYTDCRELQLCWL